MSQGSIKFPPNKTVFHTELRKKGVVQEHKKEKYGTITRIIVLWEDGLLTAETSKYLRLTEPPDKKKARFTKLNDEEIAKRIEEAKQDKELYLTNSMIRIGAKVYHVTNPELGCGIVERIEMKSKIKRLFHIKWSNKQVSSHTSSELRKTKDGKKGEPRLGLPTKPKNNNF